MSVQLATRAGHDGRVVRSLDRDSLNWAQRASRLIASLLRSVRIRNHPLRGDGNLVPIVRVLHRRTLGADRPFLVCDPRLRQTRATVRSAENYATGTPAFAAAIGGSLCIRTAGPPKDFAHVLTACRDPNTQVHLVLCTQSSEASVAVSCQCG